VIGFVHFEGLLRLQRVQYDILVTHCVINMFMCTCQSTNPFVLLVLDSLVVIDFHFRTVIILVVRHKLVRTANTEQCIFRLFSILRCTISLFFIFGFERINCLSYTSFQLKISYLVFQRHYFRVLVHHFDCLHLLLY
jgi:hypothetical protein